MRYTSLTFTAIILTIVGGLSITEPARSQNDAKLDHSTVSETKQPDLKIRVFLEKDGKLLDSYESHHVGYDAGDVKCVGVLSPSADSLWRLHVDADMSESELSSIHVRIEDLRRLTKSEDSMIILIDIYSSCVSASGIGTYEIGRLQGITIKVEISKEAAQAVPSDGHKPTSRILPTGSTTPADAH